MFVVQIFYKHKTTTKTTYLTRVPDFSTNLFHLQDYLELLYC